MEWVGTALVLALLAVGIVLSVRRIAQDRKCSGGCGACLHRETCRKFSAGNKDDDAGSER